MLGYGYVLAHAGYGVVLLDFAGHGANATPLTPDAPVLADEVAVATAVLQSQPEIDPTQLAMLGHSMGSGAIMQTAVDHGELYRAAVAVSPTGADVNPAWPRNFLLMAGSLEAPFVANAQDLLARAGGANPICPPTWDGRWWLCPTPSIFRFYSAGSVTARLWIGWIRCLACSAPAITAIRALSGMACI